MDGKLSDNSSKSNDNIVTTKKKVKGNGYESFEDALHVLKQKLHDGDYYDVKSSSSAYFAYNRNTHHSTTMFRNGSSLEQ